MVLAPPTIPWQVTGNHWLSVPCLHPADGSIYAVGAVSVALRAAVEFAGGEGFMNAECEPLLAMRISTNGERLDLRATSMAWQRVFEWLPTFNATVGDLVIRGTVFAPCCSAADSPGFVYVLALENRAAEPVTVTIAAEGTLGLRQHRVRSARPFTDPHRVTTDGDVVVLTGEDANTPLALAIAGHETTPELSGPAAAPHWSLMREFTIEPGGVGDAAVYVGAGPEADGATATVKRLRRLGWRALADTTHQGLAAMQQATGVAAADRLINRHLMFTCFYSAARAIEDARLYLMRSRAPWNGFGITIRDFDALMWIVPAIQLADPPLARELILRACELHGYAAGRGIAYIDGAPFELGFCTDGAAAFPVAIDRYVAQTGDDRIVEESIIAETLYGLNDDLRACRHPQLPLYRTESHASGAPVELPYTLHCNAIVAEALDVLKHTLDEKTAESVESAEVVRAAILRQFANDKNSARSTLATATDLAGVLSERDDPVASVYWLPTYDMLSRDDSLYRRTVRRVDAPEAETMLAARCARLIGPEGAEVLEWLRRADLDGGLAAEFVDESGRATGNGGDAALSGLVAYSVWYAVTVLGVGRV